MTDRRKNAKLAEHVRTAYYHKDQRSEIMADRRTPKPFGLPRILFCPVGRAFQLFMVNYVLPVATH